MSAENPTEDRKSPPGNPLPPKSERRSVLGRVYRFLRSPLGIAVLALVGAVLGSAVTEFGNYLERAHEERSSTVEERARELGSLHDTLGKAIVQREIATDMIVNAFMVGGTRLEIDQLWDKYNDAYRTEELVELQSHLLVTGHTDDDPDPAHPTGMEYFWYYLDTVIQGRFDSIHRCLLKVHEDFVDAADPIDNRFQKARVTLQSCETDGGWTAQAYTYLDYGKTTHTSAVATWDDFKGCLEDFVDLQDLNARIQRRVWQANSWSRSLVKAMSPEKADDDCKADDPICDQQRFLRGLEVTLEESCGKEVRGYN